MIPFSNLKSASSVIRFDQEKVSMKLRVVEWIQWYASKNWSQVPCFRGLPVEGRNEKI